MAVIDGKWLSKEGLTYFWSKIKAIFAKQTETNVIANLGAKNRLEIQRYGVGDTATSQGRTFTILADGGIKIEGSHTGTANYADVYLMGSWNWTPYVMSLSNVPHIASIQAPDVASNTDKAMIYLQVYDRHTGSTVQSVSSTAATSGSTFSFDPTIVYVSIHKNLVIPTGGIKVYPMIRRAEITDSTFQPYAPTNRQLYDSMCRANVTLASDADLDKIKTRGFYHGQGANITHRPVSGSYNFTLMVIESGEFVIQVFKQLNSAGDPYIFVRRFYVYNTSWDSWYQFTGTAV